MNRCPSKYSGFLLRSIHLGIVFRCECDCFCRSSPAMNWWPIQGVPNLLSNRDSWDSHPPQSRQRNTILKVDGWKEGRVDKLYIAPSRYANGKQFNRIGSLRGRSFFFSWKWIKMSVGEWLQETGCWAAERFASHGEHNSCIMCLKKHSQRYLFHSSLSCSLNFNFTLYIQILHVIMKN